SRPRSRAQPTSCATLASDAARSSTSSGVAKALTGGRSAATSEARRPHSAGGTDLWATLSTGSRSRPLSVMRPIVAGCATARSDPEVAVGAVVEHEAAVEDHDAERRHEHEQRVDREHRGHHHEPVEDHQGVSGPEPGALLQHESGDVESAEAR